MDVADQLLLELAKYALSKTGARQARAWKNFSPLKAPHIALPGAAWGDFFETAKRDDGALVALIPVSPQRLEEHRKQHAAITQTAWVERDDHVQMEIPLNGTVPLDYLKQTIDEGHAIIWGKLSDRKKRLLELSDQPYDEPSLLDQLLRLHGLEHQRDDVHDLLRPAVLLRTIASSEDEVRLGGTKIGGQPDLPESTRWPLYKSGLLGFLKSTGQPLAFLAQIDLAEVAQVGTPIRGLPAAGLLSLFSVWGWIPEPGDLCVPSDGSERRQERAGWTQAILTPPGVPLVRRPTPSGLNSFRAAKAIPTAIQCLPAARQEPPLSALGWSADEHESYDSLESDYRSIQFRHWLKQSDWLTGRHLLGGYAFFQQQFPAEVLEKRLAMFLQIGTDPNADMCWGDGGELTFYADPQALRKGRVECLWGTCQGG